ncbi:MAG: hypothetical protein JXA20_09890 [Spirochaetes bacterium]|nr:hypothetical protein [Spirochaetota bacterium]
MGSDTDKRVLTSGGILVILHFLVSTVGLMGIVVSVTSWIEKRFIPDSTALFNEWLLGFFYNPHKPAEIIQYALSLMALFIVFIFVYIIIYQLDDDYKSKFYIYVTAGPIRTFFYGSMLAANLVFLVFSTNLFWVILAWLFIWALIASLPFSFPRIVDMCLSLFETDLRIHRQKWWITLLLLLSIVQFIFIIYPFIFETPRMINEYFDIPEQTYLHDREVDNTRYINSRNLLNTSKYDIRDRDRTAGYVNENAEREDLLKRLKAVGRKDYSREELEFLDENYFEIKWQILGRWVIHHHNFVLGPVNEYSLGKDINTIYMQYGWFVTFFLKTILEATGGVSIQSYFKALYSVYYIYYALFLFVLFIIFKRLEYVSAVFIASVTVLNYIGYQFIFLGPGLNQIRHFFDVFLVALFYLYLERERVIYYYLALLVAVFGVMANAQIGFFGSISLIAAYSIRAFVTRKINKKIAIELIVSVLALALSVYLVIWGRFGHDPVLRYYLMGVSGFRVQASVIFSFVTLFGMLYFFFLYSYRFQNTKLFLSLFLLFYSQAILFYFMWGGTIYHFLNFAPIFILTLSVFAKLVIENNLRSMRHENMAVFLLLCISIVVYIPSVLYYYHSKAEYERVFTEHKTYNWNFDSARFQSTMNPEYFSDAVDVIHRYSATNKIYMISKYDNILPLLSRRYNAMPFIEISWFLLTRKEIDLSIDAIRKGRPDYVFIDTDIHRSYNPDLINSAYSPYVMLTKESYWRIQRLDLMKRIYKSIEREYVPVERGSLITAYKRVSK